ncbi:DnaE DNA polymerase III, alpha subunit [uncultured Caudovirales phage]|uniref:DNA-directed DNA polymerase n=1 Tax=uncultured Caudovirales phage TaxID=2100421 RepID=A0A6J5Q241_9CAUD|nr:DnaE DNA polymerase III, alpha subunit [uncultured Caudovirales phage]
MRPWAHLHAHSEYSVLDGMSHIDDMVAAAVSFQHPALALTDHGLMSGAVSLYKECRKSGIEPIIGLEAYLVENPARPEGKAKEDRFHLTILARNLEGYKTLVKLSTLSHQRDRYHRKPRLSLTDFQQINTENITVLTGCYFGALQQTLVNHGPGRAESVLRVLDHTFKNLYVEIQNHHTDHGTFTDDQLAGELYAISKKVGVRPVMTQDSHYCMEDHHSAHDMMKKLVIHGAKPGEAGFPGDSYHLCSSEWAEGHYKWDKSAPQIWEDGLESMQEILEGTEIRIPVLEKYRWHVPEVSTDSLERITARCNRMMRAKTFTTKELAVYRERLRYELSIIEDTGFAGYFDLVSDYVDWCTEQNILVNARGSANGSLVAWLLGITNVDPIKWGLMVERFIDRSRKKPPDIDLDIEQTRRSEVIEYISSRFSVSQIGTFLTMSASEDDGGKGSLFVNYLGFKRRTMDPADFQQAFGADGRTLTDRIRQHSASDLNALWLLDAMKVRRSAGAHPAGFIVDSPDHRADDLIPMMLIPSSGTQVSQLTMDDVEDLGFIKVDLLGLRSLTVLRRCQELIGRADPTDLSWIPLDDKDACKSLSEGVYESAIFQMEGWAISKGIKKLKIRRTNDCITAVALFRPALLEPGYDATYISNRSPRSAKPTYPHPVFKKHLGPTYGIPLYQEQVLEVLRDLGVSPDSLNDVLKAVKGKQGGKDAQGLFDATKRLYEDLADSAGMTIQEGEEGWELIEGFVGYGFNKAHATAYGLMAYRAGYLKAHYPREYMVSALQSVSGTDKESPYIKEAKRIGVKVMRADVNLSTEEWTLDPNTGSIRRSLTSIKGIGPSVAKSIAEGAPYKDITDFVDRSGSKVSGKSDFKKTGELKGTLLILRQSGAMSEMGVHPE